MYAMYQSVCCDSLIQTLPGSSAVSSKIESKVAGDDRWTCSSDDDFAVSMRLEELQEENRRLSALTGWIERKEQEATVCSSPKAILHTPCVVVNVGEGVDEISNEEDTTALLREAGPCCHYDNLEIDPSAIVASCECVVNMPCENESARVSIPAETKGTVDSSVLASSQGNKMRAETSTLLEKPRSRGRGRPKSIEVGASRPRSRKAREEVTNEPKRPRRPRKGNTVHTVKLGTLYVQLYHCHIVSPVYVWHNVCLNMCDPCIFRLCRQCQASSR